MAQEEPVVSVVIPVGTAGSFTCECLGTVVRSLDAFAGGAELILVLNGVGDAGRKELAEILRHPKVTWIERPERLGPAPARCRGLALARGRYILLTDADCMVPDDWVTRMVEAGGVHGVASGPVEGANAVVNAYVRIEQEVDRLRNSMRTPAGSRRFPTVTNMVARRDMMAPIVDDRENVTEDFQLSLDYVERGIRVGSIDHATVRALYPASLTQCLARRAKHARGLAFVQRMWSHKDWRSFGMRGPFALAAAAFLQVWRMRLSRREQLIALVLRLWFAAAWAFYLIVPQSRTQPHRRRGVQERSG